MRSNLFAGTALALIVLLCTPVASATALHKGPTLGAGGCDNPETIRVTRLDDDGPGTLRHAIHSPNWEPDELESRSCRHIEFDVGGVIELSEPIRIRSDYVTIDGCSAPEPGITLTHRHEVPAGQGTGLLIEGNRAFTHDIILRCLRFEGIHDDDPVQKVGAGLLAVDADCIQVPEPFRCKGGWSQANDDGGVANLWFHRVSFGNVRDKFMLWGKIRDVAVTDSFFYRNPLAFLIAYYAGPADLQRRDILAYRNVFAENNERNPQLRGWIDGLEIRSNVIYAWDSFPPLVANGAVVGDGYGIRIKNETGEKPVNANIVGNVFLPGTSAADRALIYGIKPGMDMQDLGSSRCLPQGEDYSLSELGDLWVRDNDLPAANCEHYSTTDAPIAVADWMSAMTEGPDDLCAGLSAGIGAPYRTTLEESILSRVRQRYGCTAND